MFGSFRRDSILDYRGVILQLLTIVGAPVFALEILGVVPLESAVEYMRWPIGIGLIFGLLCALRPTR